MATKKNRSKTTNKATDKPKCPNHPASFQTNVGNSPVCIECLRSHDRKLIHDKNQALTSQNLRARQLKEFRTILADGLKYPETLSKLQEVQVRYDYLRHVICTPASLSKIDIKLTEQQIQSIFLLAEQLRISGY